MKPPTLEPTSEKPKPASPPDDKPKNFEYKNPTEEDIIRKQVVECANTLHDGGAVISHLVTGSVPGAESTRALNGKIFGIARARIKKARKQLDKLAVELNRKGFA